MSGPLFLGFGFGLTSTWIRTIFLHWSWFCSGLFSAWHEFYLFQQRTQVVVVYLLLAFRWHSTSELTTQSQLRELVVLYVAQMSEPPQLDTLYESKPVRSSAAAFDSKLSHHTFRILRRCLCWNFPSSQIYWRYWVELSQLCSRVAKMMALNTTTFMLNVRSRFLKTRWLNLQMA